MLLRSQLSPQCEAALVSAGRDQAPLLVGPGPKAGHPQPGRGAGVVMLLVFVWRLKPSLFLFIYFHEELSYVFIF